MGYVFSLVLGWFPSVGAHSTAFMGTIPHNLDYYLDYLAHMVLPTATVTLATVGYTTRMVRSAMLNVLREDYIVTARSKGLKERTVLYKHALKNAMLPVVTVIGLRAAVMLGGAPLVEFIFGWPGLGMYFINAVRDVNYYAVSGATIFLGVLIVVVNVLVDISYKWLDPRVEL
jgi:ABC-type dipeptide/oligopeptide/nickel transport system permease component